jgi:hypothetical protein
MPVPQSSGRPSSTFCAPSRTIFFPVPALAFLQQADRFQFLGVSEMGEHVVH